MLGTIVLAHDSGGPKSQAHINHHQQDKMRGIGGEEASKIIQKLETSYLVFPNSSNPLSDPSLLELITLLLLDSPALLPISNSTSLSCICYYVISAWIFLFMVDL
jgi:hypothetical protein